MISSAAYIDTIREGREWNMLRQQKLYMPKMTVFIIAQVDDSCSSIPWISGENPSGNFPFPIGTSLEVTGIRCHNPTTVSGCRFWQVPAGSGRNRINPVTRSVHRNTASMKSSGISQNPVVSCRTCLTWVTIMHLCTFKENNTSKYCGYVAHLTYIT